MLLSGSSLFQLILCSQRILFSGREFQQSGKTGNSAKQENWKFNKNWKLETGFITKATKRGSYEAALSGIQMSMKAGIQETNSMSFWYSQTFNKSGMAISVHSLEKTRPIEVKLA